MMSLARRCLIGPLRKNLEREDYQETRLELEAILQAFIDQVKARGHQWPEDWFQECFCCGHMLPPAMIRAVVHLSPYESFEQIKEDVDAPF